MKKFLFLMAIVAGMFASCQDDNVVESVDKDFTRFTATFEKPSSRVYLGDDDYARWDLNDEVSVFGSDHYIYKATGVTNESKTATLTYSGEPTFTNSIMAVFPYAANNSLDETNTLYSELPAEQVYNKAMNNAIMVAVMPVSQADQTFVFKNSCALVKLNINTTDNLAQLKASIQSIKIESKSHALAGKVRINNDYTASIETETSKIVTLNVNGNAGELNEENQEFLLVIPAGKYESGDLTVTVDANDDLLDYTSTIYQDIEVGRSEYFVLETTLGTRVNLVDKAIMADIDRLKAQSFSFYVGLNEEEYDDYYEFQLPDAKWEHDFENKEYNLKSTDANKFIVNSFTSKSSGYENTVKEDVKITAKNLKITGELMHTSMGVYVKGDGLNVNNFLTVWENVKVLDNKIIPSTLHYDYGGLADINQAAAVITYGEAHLIDCEITGTVYSDLVGVVIPNWDAISWDVPLYDLLLANSSTSMTTMSGGKIGRIWVRNQANLTVKNDAEVNYIFHQGLKTNTLGSLTVENATVGEIVVSPGSYVSKLTISGKTNIAELRFVMNSRTDYFSGVTIEEGATIGKIYVGDEELTLAEFKAKYMPTTAAE